jgi:hypothetical protein
MFENGDNYAEAQAITPLASNGLEQLDEAIVELPGKTAHERLDCNLEFTHGFDP